MRVAFRVLAFITKEIVTISGQPQLLLLLILGPFLVLLAFGLGYRQHGPELKTIVVEPVEEEREQAISFYLSAVGSPLSIVSVTPDQEAALAELRARRVDLVAVAPPQARSTLLAGRNVRLVFYHNAIDPVRVGYIRAVVDGATGQLNRAILRLAIGEQQASAKDYEQVLRQEQAYLSEIRAALRANDRARAQELTRALHANAMVVASLWFLAREPLADPAAPASQLAEDSRQLDSLLAAPDSDAQALDQILARMQGDVERMLTALERTQRIPPEVLVAPLIWEVKGVSAYEPGYVAYHSPTVLALLIQHLCITLAALSLVDERSAGAIELFRAAPVSAGEILVGKFLAYVLVIAVTAVGLVILQVRGLAVRMLGDWWWLTVVVGALMASSLNLGFLISALAHSRSQAIQMSMLALLGSIFFSGFFVPLDDFALPVRLISYSLPVTYGIEQLRQVVLRGEQPQPLYLGALVSWAVLFWIPAVQLFRRQLVTR